MAIGPRRGVLTPGGPGRLTRAARVGWSQKEQEEELREKLHGELGKHEHACMNIYDKGMLRQVFCGKARMFGI